MTLTNTAADGAAGVFDGSAVAKGTGSISAFYPVSAFAKGYAGGTIGLNVGAATSDYKQYPSVASPDPACDILLSKSCEYESDGDVVVVDDLYFARMLSILKINLKGTYAAGEEVSWLKFSVSSGTLSGRVKADLSTPELGEWTVAKNYAWAEYSSSKPVINHATDNTVYLVVNPTTLAEGTTVTVTGETAHVTIDKTFDLRADMTFPAGNIAVLNLTINAADCSVKSAENYTLATTAGAFEAGAKYVFAFKDGEDGHYEFINNAGTSSTIDNATLTVSGGIISAPASKYVFTAEAGSTSGTFKFKNAGGNYIFANGSNTTLNTNNVSSADWLPTFIDESKTYKIQLSDASGRYWTYAGADAKNYANSNYHDQVKAETALATKDGAISVFKYVDSRSKLATPTGLSVSDMTVSWAEVANAGSYTVTINGTDYVAATNSYTYTGSAGYFAVAVVAHPTISGVDTYSDSDAAELAEATFGTPTLATPELANGGVTASSVTATWTDDANATNGYHCEIYDGMSKVAEKDVDAGVETVTFSGLTKGTEYSVKVNAKAVTGAKPWVASAVASINLRPAGVQVADITSAGTYNVTDLTVMAVSGRNIIAADASGAILIYASSNSHGCIVNDVLTVNGSVVEYNGVWEFNTPTITKTGTTTPVYPTPVTYDSDKITAYASAPVTEYATATGVANSSARSITVATGKVLNVYGDLSSVDGKTVVVNGYAFGYKDSKVNYMLVGDPTIDPTVPALTTDPADGSTIEWADDEYGAGEAKTISVTLNGAATGYTVSSGSSAWTVSDNGSGAITVYPNAANSSTTDDKTLDVTITHKDNGALTSTITLKQSKQGGGVPPANTVLFSETFDSAADGTSAYVYYSATGTTGAYNSATYGTITYSRSNNSNVTVENASSAGGTAKQIMINKNGGSLTISGIKTYGATSVRVSFKYICAKSTAPITATCGSTDSEEFSSTSASIATFDATVSGDTFDLVIRKTSTANSTAARFDDITITVIN